ncbi:hypothetical protein ACFORL_10205 [Legionella dresdenensis]|uniref:Uncharacterized protein n=1 Tax=Legionella dresdenensis TaxID=450200 RepID=A0ABV8CGL8_9GAMM
MNSCNKLIMLPTIIAAESDTVILFADILLPVFYYLPPDMLYKQCRLVDKNFKGLAELALLSRRDPDALRWQKRLLSDMTHGILNMNPVEINQKIKGQISKSFLRYVASPTSKFQAVFVAASLRKIDLMPEVTSLIQDLEPFLNDLNKEDLNQSIRKKAFALITMLAPAINEETQARLVMSALAMYKQSISNEFFILPSSAPFFPETGVDYIASAIPYLAQQARIDAIKTIVNYMKLRGGYYIYHLLSEELVRRFNKLEWSSLVHEMAMSVYALDSLRQKAVRGVRSLGWQTEEVSVPALIDQIKDRVDGRELDEVSFLIEYLRIVLPVIPEEALDSFVDLTLTCKVKSPYWPHNLYPVIIELGASDSIRIISPKLSQASIDRYADFIEDILSKLNINDSEAIFNVLKAITPRLSQASIDKYFKFIDVNLPATNNHLSKAALGLLECIAPMLSQAAIDKYVDFIEGHLSSSERYYALKKALNFLGFIAPRLSQQRLDSLVTVIIPNLMNHGRLTNIDERMNWYCLIKMIPYLGNNTLLTLLTYLTGLIQNNKIIPELAECLVKIKERLSDNVTSPAIVALSNNYFDYNYAHNNVIQALIPCYTVEEIHAFESRALQSNNKEILYYLYCMERMLPDIDEVKRKAFVKNNLSFFNHPQLEVRQAMFNFVMEALLTGMNLDPDIFCFLTNTNTVETIMARFLYRVLTKLNSEPAATPISTTTGQSLQTNGLFAIPKQHHTNPGQISPENRWGLENCTIL